MSRNDKRWLKLNVPEPEPKPEIRKIDPPSDPPGRRLRMPGMSALMLAAMFGPMPARLVAPDPNHLSGTAKRPQYE